MLLGLQFPFKDDEFDATECPSQKRVSLGLGGLGKDLELSSMEAWLRGGGGKTTEAVSFPTKASPEHCCVGHGPLYQRSSLKMSGGKVLVGPTTGGQGRPEQEGRGGALGG